MELQTSLGISTKQQPSIPLNRQPPTIPTVYTHFLVSPSLLCAKCIPNLSYVQVLSNVGKDQYNVAWKLTQS